MWLSNGDAARYFTPIWGTAVYCCVLGGIVAAMWLWSRRAMRRTTMYVTAAIPKFHQGIFFARWAILTIHLVALFTFGFGDLIRDTMPNFIGPDSAVPAAVSLVPVLLAWIGLLWAQFPLDRAIREQNALYAFEFGEPVHAVPTLRQYLFAGIRQQILFTLAPLVLAGVVRDVLHVAAMTLGFRSTVNLDTLLWLATGVTVFVMAPEILRRVLPTEPLPDSPLRTRLETICHDLGLRYRDILLWHTHHTLGNAAVMGIVPWVRYIMLSDRLIDTMSEDQIAAVFAHEAGHVVYRHIAWYGVFIIVFMIAANGGDMLRDWAVAHLGASGSLMNWAELVAGAGIFFAGFGALSRAFERQADVFATRCLPTPAVDQSPRPEGVAIFTSALAHVARVNNMPMDAASYVRGRGRIGRWYGHAVHHAATWLHGGIGSRIAYLQQLPGRPEKAARFDQLMYAIRVALIVALCSCTAWALTSMR